MTTAAATCPHYLDQLRFDSGLFLCPECGSFFDYNKVAPHARSLVELYAAVTHGPTTPHVALAQWMVGSSPAECLPSTVDDLDDPDDTPFNEPSWWPTRGK